MNERAPRPSILMGDLNAAPDSKPSGFCGKTFTLIRIST